MPDKYFPIHPEQSARLGQLAGAAVREDALYTDSRGREKSGTRKRAEQAVEPLQEILRKVLGPEEVTLYVARVTSTASALEQLFFRWHAFYVITYLLVFTNRRLLSFAVEPKGFLQRSLKWNRRLRAALWGDIEDASVKGWLIRQLQLKFRSGKKDTLNLSRHDDGNKIKVLFAAVSAAGARESSADQSLVSLCPNCQAPLTPAVYECPRCHLAFKDEKTLVQRALLIPGGGYFYVGRRAAGAFQFMLEAYFLVLTAMFLFMPFGGRDFLADPGQPPTPPAAAWVAAAFLVAIVSFVKWIMVRGCRRIVREYVPIK